MDRSASSTLGCMPIVGDVLAGRYRVDAPLGAGGMASVYRARDLRLDRDVAIKVLLPNLAADPRLAARFDREARALAAASHPNVVSVFDVDPGDPATGREPFYVMELCDGGSLADRLAASGRLDPVELVATVGAVAEGLVALHRRGMVHRDVKPHNILYSGGRAKLADFGLARSEQPSETSALTAPGTTVGTLAYLAPELIGGALATPASDVYALGVAAFQALTGQLPRPGASMTEIVESRAIPPPTVSSVAPELGPAFDGPIAQALSVEPAARPGPAGLAAGLTAALHVPARDGSAAGAAAAALTETSIPTPPAPRVGRTTTPRRLDVPAAPVAPAPVRPRRRGRPALVALTAFALTVAALLALASNLRGPDGAGAGATPAASTTPTPRPTPTPTPAITADPAAPALEAVDRLVAAIDAARGGDDGLKGKDAKDLQDRAGAARTALRRHDYAAARAAARDLANRIDRLDGIDGDIHDRLRQAATELVDAIPA